MLLFGWAPKSAWGAHAPRNGAVAGLRLSQRWGPGPHLGGTVLGALTRLWRVPVDRWRFGANVSLWFFFFTLYCEITPYDLFQPTFVESVLFLYIFSFVKYVAGNRVTNGAYRKYIVAWKYWYRSGWRWTHVFLFRFWMAFHLITSIIRSTRTFF